MKRTLVLTSPHMTGDDVKYAQRVLKKHGGYYQGKADGEYGPLAAQAAYRAQYWLGYATPKQTFGAANAKPLREKALAAMGKFVGLAETPPGSNHVPEINGWWGGGDVAWCARTVSKAYITAGSKAFVRGRNYEYVPTIVGDARAGRNNLTVTLDPQPGDLVCFDWDGSNFRTGENHVGMFLSGTAGRFKTIEGNVDSCCAYH